MMHDGYWELEQVDDEPPFVGRAALAMTLVGVTCGVLVVAGALVALSWLRNRAPR